ncbi:MAG: hypothetical protein RIR91_1783 [Verrucomicrobiota bacterium]
MRFLSVCSGMEAASIAFEPLGWKAVGFCEIDPFASAVLAHRFPNTPNYGDLTQYKQWPIEPGAIDVLIGGPPCQAFSVAGLRRGLADPRGNLTLTYLGLVDHLRPEWVIYENVPGLLSVDGGRTFGTFLHALGQLGYGWAYRILDAQHVGECRLHPHRRGWSAVPQRRRRIFVVARRGAGGWASAAEVLSLREGLQRHLAAGGKKRQGVAPDAGGGAEESLRAVAFQPGNLCRQAGADPSTTTFPTLKCDAGDQAPHVAHPVVPLDGMNLLSRLGKCGETHSMQEFNPADPSFTLRRGGMQHGVLTPMAVRRLTPNECLRLQGFPDNWTNIPWKGKPTAPDGPQYKCAGNSFAVPVVRWIGTRIASLTQNETQAQQNNGQ